MNYKQIAKTNPAKLYLLRNASNAKEIDALLDGLSRNNAPKRRRKAGKGMIDYQRENNRWYIEDDGTICNIPA